MCVCCSPRHTYIYVCCYIYICVCVALQAREVELEVTVQELRGEARRVCMCVCYTYACTHSCGARRTARRNTAAYCPLVSGRPLPSPAASWGLRPRALGRSPLSAGVAAGQRGS